MKALENPILEKPNLGRARRILGNADWFRIFHTRVWFGACAVAAQLTEHLNINKLLQEMLSAYRLCHSLETALLGIHNDILWSLDKQQGTLLALLDLSAAFDTVDHQILLGHLENCAAILLVLLLRALPWTMLLRIYVEREGKLHCSIPVFLSYVFDSLEEITTFSSTAVWQEGYSDLLTCTAHRFQPQRSHMPGLPRWSPLLPTKQN